ncbi:MAG: calcium/proton exchanger [Candidatus Altiarchaeales archaeon]|nr:calcium/proton exchanger [Candidatus Altiarchaeales archaeon]
MVVRLEKITLLLLLFVPVSVYFSFFTEDRLLTFVTSVFAIIPLARIIGYATKEVILQTRPVFGGFLNATFGNAVELIIAVFALRAGLLQVVQASIVGSVLNNLLLLIGLSIFFGGLKYKKQTFNKESVGVSSTMLIIAIVGLTIPTIFSLTVKANSWGDMMISNAVAVVLAVIYLAGILFAFITHKHLFDASDEIKAERETPQISVKTAAIILLLTTIAVVFESELLVEGFKHAIADYGLSQAFVGVVVIATITNIAEKINAVHFARENKLDVALEIGLTSATQIALFVVPILVFVSHIFDYGFSLVFSPFEIVSVFFAVMIVNYLSSDGKCNWLEGVQLISVYLIIAIAFYFI